MLPTLYGKASTGKTKQWSVTTYGDEVVVSYGQLGGKIAEKRTTSKPKNLGRSNETTGAEQALLEAQSKWNKQLKKDYRESVEDIPSSTLPNLAHKYQDKAHTINWDQVWELPKLDGVRCTVFKKDGAIFFQSRGGEAYPVIAEIAAELEESFFKDHPGSFVDGELYCHGMYLEDITSCVKKHNEDTKKIQFHIFDWIRHQDDPRCWFARYVTYKFVMHLRHSNKGKLSASRLRCVTASQIISEQDMLTRHAEYVASGYEGIIIRGCFDPYSFGNRTTGIIKYKVPISEEFEVVDFELDKNGAGVPVCRYITPEGEEDTFKAPFAATAEKRKALYENRANYIGEFLTVDYEKRSKYGKPTKPIGKAFRKLDEDGNPLE
jgi:DNA ligase-1